MSARHNSRFVIFFHSVFCFLITTLAVRADASFQGLGFLPGATTQSSSAYGTSADGSIVVGASSDATTSAHAFRWTRATGLVPLDDLGGGLGRSWAYAISADGSTIVGSSDLNQSGTERRAYRWTQSTGMVALPAASSGFYPDFASEVSADGHIISGTYRQSTPFYWSSDGGTIQMPAEDLIPGFQLDSINAMSADGNVIAGGSHQLSSGVSHGYYWQSGVGAIDLGQVTVGDISEDGLTVVGGYYDVSPSQPFRWTSSGGYELLGTVPGVTASPHANAVSADGSVIVGTGVYTAAESFIWDEAHGMRLIRTMLLDDYGIDVGQWQLRSASDITPDGRTIVGTGINPSGQSEAWIIHIPEPATFLLLVVGGACALRRRVER